MHLETHTHLPYFTYPKYNHWEMHLETHTYLPNFTYPKYNHWGMHLAQTVLFYQQGKKYSWFQLQMAWNCLDHKAGILTLQQSSVLHCMSNIRNEPDIET